MSSAILAQGLNINTGVGSTVSITGPLVDIESLTDVVNVVTTFLYPFAGVILLLILIWGGYDYLSSGGDPEKVKSGQAKITAGVIGFVLLM
nr:hypothetical protein [Candidatus Woesebacteria bacterium]